MQPEKKIIFCGRAIEKNNCCLDVSFALLNQLSDLVMRAKYFYNLGQKFLLIQSGFFIPYLFQNISFL